MPCSPELPESVLVVGKAPFPVLIFRQAKLTSVSVLGLPLQQELAPVDGFDFFNGHAFSFSDSSGISPRVGGLT